MATQEIEYDEAELMTEYMEQLRIEKISQQQRLQEEQRRSLLEQQRLEKERIKYVVGRVCQLLSVF